MLHPSPSEWDVPEATVVVRQQLGRKLGRGGVLGKRCGGEMWRQLQQQLVAWYEGGSRRSSERRKKVAAAVNGGLVEMVGGRDAEGERRGGKWD